MNFNIRLLVIFFIATIYFGKPVELSASSKVRVSVGFLPGGNALEEVVDDLRRARERIDLGLFYLTHDAVIDVLCYRASKGVEVNVYLDSVMRGGTYKKKLRRLARAGANIFTDYFPKNGKLHTKFCVIDSEKVITGSANWTVFGLSINYEDLLLIKDEKFAGEYLSALEQMKKYLKPYNLKVSEKKRRCKMPDDKDYVLSKYSKYTINDRDVKIYHVEEPIQLFFSPLENPIKEIVKSLESAKKSIEVSMFSISNAELINALLKAKKRGVDVKVVVDETMLISSYRRVLQSFYDHGIPVSYYHNDYGIMHLKTVVIDGETIWRGSGNWTNSALDTNFEEFMQIKSERIARFYSEFFEEMVADSVAFIGNEKSIEDKMLAVDSSGENFKWQKQGKFNVGLPPAKIRTKPADFDIFNYKTAPAKAVAIKGNARYLDDEQYFPMLMHLVENAKQSIMVSMFLASWRPESGQEHLEELLKELENAAERGVYVYIVFEVPKNASSGFELKHSKLCERLRKAGIDARLNVPSLNIHDKFVIVDLCKIIIGSHNWSEGALAGDRVMESSVLIVSDKQQIELSDYITSRKAIYNMSTPEDWNNEIEFLRKLDSMNNKSRTEYLEKYLVPKKNNKELALKNNE